jgi:hypothetical protein
MMRFRFRRRAAAAALVLSAGLASCYNEKKEGRDASGETGWDADDFRGDDHDAAAGDPDGMESGCDQELPRNLDHVADFCGAQYPASCLDFPCGSCELCYVDLSCGPIDDPDAPNCGCMGDGRCHALCRVNEDCGAEEECIELCLADGTDVVGASRLWVCWEQGSSPAARCD